MVAFTKYRSDPRVRREAEALAERGDQVDVVCQKAAEMGRAPVHGGVHLYEVGTPRYRGSSALAYVAQYAMFFLAAALKVSRLHVKQRYDVVQVHTLPDFMVFSALICKVLGAKVILDVHDLTPELYESKFGLADSHAVIRALKWIERRSIGFADRAIAVHEPHLQALVEHGNPREKFEVLLNVPDPKVVQPHTSGASSDSSFKLVYHGTIAHRHGLDVAVRAVSLVREEIEGIAFLIVGAGDEVPQLERLTAELGLEEIVHVHDGVLPLEELLPMIADADVGVVPIRYDRFTRYMLPVKLLEYVALGIPVVCSDTETIRFYFADTMLAFFTPGDERALAARLLELYRHPARRKALTQQASAFAEEFSWQEQKLRYYELIDSLVHRAP